MQNQNIYQLSINLFNERYHLNYPQIVQMDERYLCLIGGTQKKDCNDFQTPRLPEVKEDYSDEP
jgi:hypothetical protein